jgi:predicted dehydrogenase
MQRSVHVGDQLKIGVIGLGKMGSIRIGELGQRKDVLLLAGSDPNESLWPDFPSTRVTSDYRDVIGADVDAVFVCTPNRFTPEVVIAALDAGKHVFAEKPPGRTVDDVRKIIEAEQRHPGQKLKFGFNHRYHAGIQEAKRIIDSGRLGPVLWARGIYGKSGGNGFEREWRSSKALCGGGILLDQGIHMLDLFRFFMGDFVEVKSMVTTAFWNIELEDNAFALLRDRVGRVAMLHSSSTQWKHRFNLELYTTEGFVAVNGILSSTRSYGEETITVAHKRIDQVTATGKPREEVIYFDTDPSWALEVDEFIKSVRSGSEIVYGSSSDALAAMELVHAIYHADEQWVQNGCGRRGSSAIRRVRSEDPRVGAQ